jgi:hypothetical protein
MDLNLLSFDDVKNGVTAGVIDIAAKTVAL